MKYIYFLLFLIACNDVKITHDDYDFTPVIEIIIDGSVDADTDVDAEHLPKPSKRCPYDDTRLVVPASIDLNQFRDAGNFDQQDFDVDLSSVTEPFCIDQYEWPNQKGTYPVTGVSAKYAETECAKVGKRLPTRAEWVTACLSSSNVYEYGNQYRRGVCRDDAVWRAPNWNAMAKPATWSVEVKRLYQAVPSGSREGCRSNDVYDMVGNAGEYVTDEKSKYKFVMMGCYWGGCFRPEHPSCLYVNQNHDFYNVFYSYESSFRCVKNSTY